MGMFLITISTPKFYKYLPKKFDGYILLTMIPIVTIFLFICICILNIIIGIFFGSIVFIIMSYLSYIIVTQYQKILSGCPKFNEH